MYQYGWSDNSRRIARACLIWRPKLSRALGQVEPIIRAELVLFRVISLPSRMQAENKFSSSSSETKFSSMAAALTFLTSQRGRRIAVHQGFQYTQHRPSQNGNPSRWECTQRNPRCPGRLSISADEENVTVLREHNHVSDHGAVKAKALVAGMKRTALDEPTATTSGLIRRTRIAADSEANMSLPHDEALKRMVRREKAKGRPPAPKTLADLQEIPEEYSLIDGQSWIILGVDAEEDEHERIVAFGRRRTLRAMSLSNLWFLDGTFKTAPAVAHQLYTIHYQIQNDVLPGVYAFMSHKSEDSYTRLFNAVRNHLPENRQDGPANFSMDFELAAANAFQNIFTNGRPAFCFFHMGQSLFRTLQEAGLQGRYNADGNEELRHHFHAILGLPFVPIPDVRRAFDILKRKVDPGLAPVLELLENYYVLGRRRGRGRQPPRFPPESWNVHQRVLDGLPRTNKAWKDGMPDSPLWLGKFTPHFMSCCNTCSMRRSTPRPEEMLLLAALLHPISEKSTPSSTGDWPDLFQDTTSTRRDSSRRRRRRKKMKKPEFFFF